MQHSVSVGLPQYLLLTTLYLVQLNEYLRTSPLSTLSLPPSKLLSKPHPGAVDQVSTSYASTILALRVEHG